jgi:thermostable 8-oxoguanine DNA glycosylase
MYYNSENKQTTFTEDDYQKLIKITKELIHHLNMPQLGLYKEIGEDEIWLSLVLQFCVVSGKRMTEDLRENKQKLEEFSEKINFRKLTSMKNKRKEYVSGILKEFRATSFYNKQAERIEDVLNNPEIIKDRKMILLNSTDHTKHDFKEIRDYLIKKVPHFKLKSASEFMIENGLSIDVIAINTRIGEALNHHFDLNIDNQKIQSSRLVYESIEQCLRDACRKIGIPLAYLSRMLFYYSEKDTISYILEEL